MSESKDLEKQLKLAVKTGRFVVGRREVFRSLKGSKMLVWSAGSDLPPELLDQSKSLGIPALRFMGNPVQLGKACGIPFRVSVIALKSSGDADISSFSNSADYGTAPERVSSAVFPRPVSPEVVPRTKDDVEKSPVTAEPPKDSEKAKGRRKKKTEEEVAPSETRKPTGKIRKVEASPKKKSSKKE